MYIDPAAGSLILQIAVAGFFAVATTLRSTRETIGRLFRSLFGWRKDK